MARQRDWEAARVAVFVSFLDALSRTSVLSPKRRAKFGRSAIKRRNVLESLIFQNANIAAQIGEDAPAPPESAAFRSVFQPDLTLQLKSGVSRPLQTDMNPTEFTHRILIVCPIPPTVNHAGGLRQIDMLQKIKSRNPRAYIELFTRINIGDCGPLDLVSQVADRVVIAPYDNLSLDEYVRLSPDLRSFDVVDFQFPQHPDLIDAFRAIGHKMIFTPMESHIRNECIARGVKAIAAGDLLTPDAREEARICDIVDQTVCVSAMDRDAIAACLDADVIAIETGVSDIEFSGDIEPVDPFARAVCFVAYFGSPTNREALRWYLELVHPRVLEAFGDYEFRIVGRGDVAEILSSRPRNVRHVGEVARVGPHIKAAAIGVAPALSGSGFRGKINQYAHLGVPTVASSLSADGLAYVDGTSIMIADSPADFADRIIALLRAPDSARAMGEAAASVCRSTYGWGAKWPDIATVYALSPGEDRIAMPSVHAVIPSYQHAEFIEERIRSVLAQQYPNIRVTVIDDHSDDNSHEIILRLQAEHGFEYIRRDANSGTPFSAWKYAAENTAEDLVWICESDDAANPMLVASLVRQLTQRKQTGIAYCASWIVDGHGDVLKATDDYFAEVFHPTRWRAPFIARGADELRQYLRFGMVVPNMSSALIATEVFRKAFTPDVMTFRLAGDWLFLGQAMQHCDIAFIPDRLNRFRQHAQTSRSRTGRARQSAEHICVRLRLSALSGVSEAQTVDAIRYDLRELASDPALAEDVMAELRRLDPLRAVELVALLRKLDQGLPEGQVRELISDADVTVLIAVATEYERKEN